MEFYINQYSTLPTLSMELIDNGLKDYDKFVECIQDADIYFTMYNIDTNIYKVSNSKAYIRLKEGSSSCHEEYLICYDWKKHDTKEKGRYKAFFTIVFKGNISSEIYQHKQGDLIMPIREDLIIVIK